MYYGARYYDAAIGRFVQADTIVPNAGNPQALNRYAYTLNNPVRYTDPTGYHEDCDSGPCPELDHTLRSVIHELGFTPEGIGAWGNDELKELRDWLKAGVRFTSEAVVTSAGELLLSKPWSGPNLADALAALRAVKDKLGANTMEALGLVNGGTLTLNSLLAGRADPGAVGGFRSSSPGGRLRSRSEGRPWTARRSLTWRRPLPTSWGCPMPAKAAAFCGDRRGRGAMAAQKDFRKCCKLRLLVCTMRRHRNVFCAWAGRTAGLKAGRLARPMRKKHRRGLLLGCTYEVAVFPTWSKACPCAAYGRTTV